MIGAVKNHFQWRFFAGTIAEWILDYSSYDPSYDPKKSRAVFRNNLLQVNEGNADAFCNSMETHELFSEDILNLVSDATEDEATLTVVVDFDNTTLVNGFYDIPIEDYVPNNWTSYFGNPLEYVPEEIRFLWKSENTGAF